ncbi:TetR family transcriptional regulator, partial [Enterococcus faecium]
DLIRIQDRDLGNLPPAAKRQVRRKQRQYVEIWVDVLQRRDPRLTEAAARVMAHGTFGLLNSTAHSMKPGATKTAEASSR